MSRSNRPNINAADSITRAQLKFLSDLAQSGKFSRTAEHLGLSLSAASRMLDRLREAFGDPLFTPHARGLTPTDAMLRLEPELRRTIEQTDRLFSQPSFDPATLRRTFSIAARGLVVPELLAYAIGRVAREAPGVHLEMHHRTSRIWDQIEAGELDLALVPDRAVPPALRTLPLFPIEIGILLREDHPLVREFGGGAPALSAFLRYKRLAMTVSANLHNASWDRQLLGEVPERRDQVVCSSTNAIDLAVALEESDFLMLVPKRGALSMRSRYKLAWLPLPAELPQPAAKQIVLVWRESLQRDPAHQWLRGIIRDWARRGEAAIGGVEKNEAAQGAAPGETQDAN